MQQVTSVFRPHEAARILGISVTEVFKLGVRGHIELLRAGPEQALFVTRISVHAYAQQAAAEQSQR